jgi:glycosyltransferase involved in cell wall biosynthesis
MRILLVSSGSGSRGGGEIFLDYLGKGLADRGHDVLVWIPSSPRMDELAEKCAIFGRVIRADYRNTYDYRMRSLVTCFNWGVSRRIAREWQRLKPDVIHVNKQNLEDGLDLLRAARWSSLPSVCTIHLTQTARFLRAKAPGLRDLVARDALAKYRGIFVAVQKTRQNALDNFLGARARTRTIFNGVPFVDQTARAAVREAKRRELGLTDGDFLILGLGRLVEQKRPFFFLKTAQEIHRHFRAARFLWIGDGELSTEWEKWVAREKLGGTIGCAGWQAEVLPFLFAGDALLHVAEFEGLPLAIIEAMAAGLPCAVTREFASEITLFNEDTVLFLDDSQLFASKLNDRKGLAAIAVNARNLANDKLSLPGMVDAYEQLYLEAGR